MKRFLNVVTMLGMATCLIGIYAYVWTNDERWFFTALLSGVLAYIVGYED